MPEPTLNTILVVVYEKDDGEIVLEKAHRLAKQTHASLYVLRTVYEEFAELSIHDIETSNELKTYLLQAEEAVLEEMIEPLRQAGVNVESATVWHPRHWQSILEQADDCKAQLIIKGTETQSNGHVRTPTDWNLLRHSPIPVMLVKPINWVDKPVILAALDVTGSEDEELNVKILSHAGQLATALGGEVHAINCYPTVEHWMGPITVVVDFDQVRTTVSKQIAAQVKKLVDKTGITVKQIHAVEGITETGIKKTVAQLGAELLVIGTHHRSGARGIFMGNTSEKILYTVECDVEVLH